MTGLLPWLRAFALTLAVELAVAPVLLREGSLRRRLTVVLLANALSHPVVWFAFPLVDASYTVRLLIAEAFAVASETVVYRAAVPEVGWSRALAASALANAASLGFGLALRHLGGWV